MIVPSILEPKGKELLGISNPTVVFGLLNLLKKPTAFYLRLDFILKRKYIFMICVALRFKVKKSLWIKYRIDICFLLGRNLL